MKGQGCCGEDEDTNNAEEDGCCKDEGLFLQNNNHFTVKNISYQFPILSTELFYIFSYNLPFPTNAIQTTLITKSKAPPPKLISSLLVSTSVFRI
jgi:hypothetical protein